VKPHESPSQPGGFSPLEVASLEAALAGCALGQPIYYFLEIGSTNTYALELARQGTPDGTLIITDHQTTGRGRVGRVWQSLPGQQLALSLVLHPQFPPHLLVMASALAVVGAVEVLTELRPDIKWPNDVLLDGKKLCGILIESSSEYAIVGIGLNVNGSFDGDSELAARTITLAQALGHDVSRETLAAELLRRLDEWYAQLNTDERARSSLRERWRERLVTLGHSVTVRQGGQVVTGIAEDVDAGGALLVRTDDGELHTITWGDVE
jgi:BirA family transcriptional regulator, biotin operon repressor / biotin---[acetyl-CoA-carboxylase] ligase